MNSNAYARLVITTLLREQAAAATFGVALALGEAVPWASKLAAIVMSI